MDTQTETAEKPQPKMSRKKFNALMKEGAEIVRMEKAEEKRLMAEARAEYGKILHTPFLTRLKNWWASLWAKPAPIPTNEFTNKATEGGFAGWLKKL